MKKLYKEITLTTSDNVRLRANYYDDCNSDSVVIIAPGWCMTKDSNAFLQISNDFRNYFDVLSFDFRGHGRSAGLYTFGAKEESDLDTVVTFAKEKKYKNIYLAGFSLGSMIALIYCAKENIAVKKLIAVSAPADFDKIENKMWKKEAWGETFKKFELFRFLSIRPSVIPYKKVKPIDIIDNLKIPVLFIAGRKDPTVCYWHSEKLYENAKCPKKFKVFENGIHSEDLYLHFKKEFMETCLDWLNLKE